MARAKNDVVFVRPVVWVIGASQGIGREIALQFSTIGCHVCVSSRTASRLRVLCQEIEDLGGAASAYPCDITQHRDVVKTSRAIERNHRRIDAMILVAGITSFQSFARTPREDLRAILATNLSGPVDCFSAVLPGMIRRRKGWIASVLSTAAISTFRGSSAYSAAKAGLLAFTRVVREEVRQHNIRVVDVLPGPTATTMWPRQVLKRRGKAMMSPRSVAEALLEIFRLPDDVVVEELVLRPPMGDVN